MRVIRTPKQKKDHKKSFWYHLLFKAGVFESSATLSYYFLFSMFPMLIIISAAFSAFHMDPDRIRVALEEVGIIPGSVVKLITGYVSEVTTSSSWVLISIGVVLTLYSMGKTIEILKRHIRLAFSSKPEKTFLSEILLSVILVVLMIVGFYATLILVVSGSWLIRWAVKIFSLSESVPVFFHSLRILVPALYLFFLLWGMYHVLPGIKMKPKESLPGAVFAMTFWILASWAFSFYVDNMNDYSRVYGSLGAFIVLLVWLHLISFIILCGAHLNAHLYFKNHGENNDQ